MNTVEKAWAEYQEAKAEYKAAWNRANDAWNRYETLRAEGERRVRLPPQRPRKREPGQRRPKLEPIEIPVF